MTILKYTAAAALLATPMLLVGAPAQAITARQLSLQGRGIYSTSKGVPNAYSLQPNGLYAEQGVEQGSPYQGFQAPGQYPHGYGYGSGY